MAEARIQAKGELFPAEVVSDMFTKVRGKSSIASLCGETPIPFNGMQTFTFSMDNEVNIVAENGQKPAGGITVEPVVIQPLKIEYGARISDEFLYASEEKQLDILTQFTDGYSKKVARGLDIMSMHGVNPRDGLVSSLIGTNSFDTNTGVAKVTYTAGSEESNLEDAIAALGEYDNTGYAISKKFGAALGKLKANGVRQFPEFALGGNPEALNGIPCSVNSTVSFGTNKDEVILGDFAGAFKWGYAREIPMEIIQYGDPDGTGKDLKNYNQVYLRAETYIGWGILLPAAFVRITGASA